MKSESQNKRFTPIPEGRQVSMTGDCVKANRAGLNLKSRFWRTVLL